VPLLLAALVGALTACGGGAPAANPQVDRETIQGRLAAYTRALATGDGEAACAAYTPALRASFDRRAAAGGLGACPAALRVAGQNLVRALPKRRRNEILSALIDPGSVRVDLRGDRATAGYDPREVGSATQQVAVERVEGLWKISALGVRPGAPPAAP